MTLPAMPQVRRPDQAKNPQAITASVASAVEIGPVSAWTSWVSVDCTGCSVPPACASADPALTTRRAPLSGRGFGGNLGIIRILSFDMHHEAVAPLRRGGFG